MNAIVLARIESHTPRLKLLGRYDAGDLHRAMRVALGRAHLRALRAERERRSPVGCDVKADGTLVSL